MLPRKGKWPKAMKANKRKPPPRATPAPLMELCHDALATGVLERHNGLPPTWIEMFKKHPAAWKQLQTELLKSMGRQEEWLTETSNVMILYYDSEPTAFPLKYRAFSLPAKALPEWLYELLHAYFKALCFKPFYSRHQDLDKCGMGGYEVDFTQSGKAWEIYNRIESICDHAKGALGELHDGVIGRLFFELGVDMDDIYDDLIHEEVEDAQGRRREVKDEYKDMDYNDFFKEFPDETRDALHEALDHAEDWTLDMHWADNLFEEHAALNAKKTTIRPPSACPRSSLPRGQAPRARHRASRPETPQRAPRGPYPCTRP